MRFFLLILGIFSSVAFARIGESLEQLTERYGTAKRLYDKEGGITIVEYSREGLNLEFTLLDLKAEALTIHGKLNQKEAEVLMARNVPAGTRFNQIDDLPASYEEYFRFWKTYTFSNNSRAGFYSENEWPDGWATLAIESEKFRQHQYSKKIEKLKKEITEANKRVDSIETKIDKKEEKTDTKEKRISEAKNKDEKLTQGEGSSSDDILKALGLDKSLYTPLGRYQHKLYLAINSRFNLKVQQAMAQIGEAHVLIRFYVNPDGSISDLNVIEGSPNSILSVISTDSIKQSSNLVGPFPADLLQEKPDGFKWQLSFKVKK